ncbi:hypothetical protein FZ029_05345 [Azospirillum sp. Sh1]|nr:hypothetical protein FZ029_05345 [Azospirillum sp. Sh1]
MGVGLGWRCPLPNPPPLRGRGDCRRFYKLTLSRWKRGREGPAAKPWEGGGTRRFPLTPPAHKAAAGCPPTPAHRAHRPSHSPSRP